MRRSTTSPSVQLWPRPGVRPAAAQSLPNSLVLHTTNKVIFAPKILDIAYRVGLKETHNVTEAGSTPVFRRKCTETSSFYGWITVDSPVSPLHLKMEENLTPETLQFLPWDDGHGHCAKLQSRLWSYTMVRIVQTWTNKVSVYLVSCKVPNDIHTSVQHSLIHLRRPHISCGVSNGLVNSSQL